MNKKRISLYLLSVICAGAFLTSCTDLDSDKYFDDRITEKQIFENRQSSEEWLAHAYYWLLDCNVEVSSKGGTGSTTINIDGVNVVVEGARWNPFNFADDIYYGDRDNKIGAGDNKDADFASYNSFREGNYHEDCGYAAWVRCYKGIYQASIFIHKIHMNKELTAEQIVDYRGQARFVRAYYYWLLLKKYGPTPIMADEGADYTASYHDIAIPRPTYEEAAEYISDEMLKAASEIKTLYRDAGNICRPTRGACLATRALALTYAASPLANGQLQNGKHPAGVTDDIAKLFVNKDGTPLLSREYDEKKWARAAAACKDVMELGCYELYHSGKITGVGNDGYPTTIEPFNDGNFSTKNWPDGYADIDPLQSYRKVFDGDVYPDENTELIFTRGTNFGTSDNDLGIGALVLHEMPTTLGGWNTHGVTQKMVDTYYMADGSDVDGMYSEWRSQYPSTIADGNSNARNSDCYSRIDLRKILANEPLAFAELGTLAKGRLPTETMLQNVSKMYMKREPRFYASVAYSGTIWENGAGTSNTSSNQFKQVNYFRNGGNGYVNNFQYPRTGTAMRKFCSPRDYCPNNQNNYNNITTKFETAIRYADILLMYAESLNELDGSYQIASWDGSKTYNISREINEIKKGTTPIRIRAGVPDYDYQNKDIYSDKDALRKAIKRERMIEFMGEAKRYFDLRRWMDAPIEEATPVYGLNVVMTAANKNEFFRVIPTSNLSATFSTKLYFWPISHTELKRNKNLIQAPGWTEND